MAKEPKDGWDKADIVARAAGAVALPIVVLLIGQLLTCSQQSAAERRAQAEWIERLIVHLSSTNANERALALRVAAHYSEDEAFPQELLLTLASILADPNESKNVVEAAGDALKQLERRAGGETARAAREILEAAPSRVFLQVDDRAQEERLRGARGHLLSKSFVVSPADVVANAPGTPQVRFFRPSDKAKALEVVATLKAQGIEASAVDLSESPQAARAAPKAVEVWLGARE